MSEDAEALRTALEDANLHAAMSEDFMHKARAKAQAIAKGETPKPATPPKANTWQRPPFSREKRQKVLVALQAHNFMRTACALAGVNVTTVNDWIKQGQRDIAAGVETEHSKFALDVEQAMATSEAQMVNEIAQSASRGRTDDAKWLLERRHADRWAKKDKIEVGGDPSQPIVVQLTWPGMKLDEDSDIALPASTDTDILDETVVDAELVEGDGSA